MAVLPFTFFASKFKFYVEGGYFDYKTNKKTPNSGKQGKDRFWQ